MVEWITANADKTSIITLLMMAVAALAVAWYREWFILTKTHLRIISDKEKETERVRDECKFQREMNERLLLQLEKTVRVQETVAAPILKQRIHQLSEDESGMR
jgi:hypothetical protein